MEKKVNHRRRPISAKHAALLDITEDVRSGTDYTMNYLAREKLVMELVSLDQPIITDEDDDE